MKPNPTKEELLRYATELDMMYGHLFIPSVGPPK
jgi:hypothetical protein